MSQKHPDRRPDWVLAIHGGAPRTIFSYSPLERQRRHAAFVSALDSGRAILARGGSGLDAVEVAVRILEDAPDFNAGVGSTLTHDGTAELDASIMDGREKRAGAVAGLRRVRNPILLARAVMEKSVHVFLMGGGAEEFAAKHGLELVEPAHFVTERQIEELRKIVARESSRPAEMCGTVGAVALDRNGNLAAATSTGGITNKRYGRVGDSPVIGAGTFAENGVCAVSATGWGEYFIRSASAYDVCARVKYAGVSLETAAERVIAEVDRLGGYGGLIAVDGLGRIAMTHSTARMPRGYVTADTHAIILLQDDGE
jgi:beta-aspartyl-peptidase (threonine type)